MKNVHSRVLLHPVVAVRPWLEAAWSATEDDIFPRDYIRSWRKNPPHLAVDALVPDVTRMGHGPFAFTLRKWDGAHWRVDFASGGRSGWHGFDLAAQGDRTEITHTLEGDLGLGFRLFVLPIHDWVVERMFDRLEIALATGKVPKTTAPPNGIVSLLMNAMGFFLRHARKRGSKLAVA